MDRYRLHELIGQGAMGLVYRAHDVELARDVALKTLSRADPEEVYHLKREFRALAGLAHPNLVELYDLVVAAERCFFTMELLDGTDFITHVRGAEQAGVPGPLALAGMERLRAALPQLVAGLGALHVAGRLHRDVKPSNVLVTTGGRVVLVDFGLVTERPRDSGEAAGGAGLAGTVAYMAPEQLWGAAPTPAADWYSVGVLVHQALTGRLPSQQALTGRLPSDRQPVPSSNGAHDLAALADALLSREPAARPTGAEIARLLGLVDDAAFPSTATVWEAPFVGRDTELAALRDAYAASRRGEPAVVHVQGTSGIGKTALVQHLVDEVLAHDPPPLVLAGRCRPQESVPFEALDSLVDSLSRFLVAQPPGDRAWVPSRRAALLRLFPVLGRVATLDPETIDGAAEPQEVRRQAFAALRALLEALARARPLIVWIDDLHRGDLDSAPFLRDLVQAPARGLLLLLSYRSEDRDTSPLLRELLAGGPASGARMLAVEPLPAMQARRLVRHLIPYAEAEERLDAIAAEAGGSPFLTCELARYHASRGGGAAPAGPASGISDVVGERVQRLPVEARRLLELVAVNGGPLAGTVATEAAELGRGGRPAVRALQRQCLLRDGLAGDDGLLEIYHDRIRETVVAGLASGAKRAHHLRLVTVLGARPDPDPLALLHHCRGAGQLDRAVHFATRAAEQAAGALAFNQAAWLYGLALELGPDGAARGDLLACRAGALANAGLAAEAGDAYVLAAEHASATHVSDPRVLQLRRCAAEQHLRSGRFDDGLRGLRAVLRAAGVRYPERARAAVAGTLVHRAVLAARGLRHHIRTPGEVAPTDLARLDAYWSSAVGLVWVDPIRSADFQGRHTLLALRVGEPTRVVRALATETAFQAAVGGSRGHRRAASALAAARALAARLDDPASTGLTQVCAAVAAYFAGRFQDAVPLAAEAEQTLRERCVGVAWELTNCHIAMLWSLAYGGQIAVLEERLPRVLREARDRGDLLATASLAAFLPDNLRHLAADRADEARAGAAEALGGWPVDAFLLPHYYELYSQTQIDLYAGEPQRAWDRLARAWRTLESSMLLHFQVVRTDVGALRGRAAVAAALAEDGSSTAARRRRARLLRAAGREALCLEGEDMPWCAPWASTIRAGIALARGERRHAATLLDQAVAGFEDAGMALMAAAARLRAGALEEGDTAVRLRAGALRWMEAEGVRNPGAMARLLLPDAA